MKTLHTIAQQIEFLTYNQHLSTIEHRWSSSGMGTSRIVDNQGNVLAKRGGCGYDRFGAVVGQFLTSTFQAELTKLAEKTRNKKDRPTYQRCSAFYGLFYDAVNKRGFVDGGCGYECMFTVLNAIGYSLIFSGQTDTNKRTGSSFYQLLPITKNHKEWLDRK